MCQSLSRLVLSPSAVLSMQASRCRNNRTWLSPLFSHANLVIIGKHLSRKGLLKTSRVPAARGVPDHKADAKGDSLAGFIQLDRQRACS